MRTKSGVVMALTVLLPVCGCKTGDSSGDDTSANSVESAEMVSAAASPEPAASAPANPQDAGEALRQQRDDAISQNLIDVARAHIENEEYQQARKVLREAYDGPVVELPYLPEDAGTPAGVRQLAAHL